MHGMSSDPLIAPSESHPTSRRRRPRFTIRAIFALTAAVAVVAAWARVEYRKYQRQEEIARRLEDSGILVTWEDAYFGLVRQVVSVSSTPRGMMSEAHLLKTVALLAELPSLGEVTLNEANLGDVHCDLVAQCHGLKRLDLSHTIITDEGLKRLAALKNLQLLEIVNTHVTSEGEEVLQEANPGLLILDD